MAGAGHIARRRGLLAEPDLVAQADLLRRFGLPAQADGLAVEAMLGPLSRDKKARGKTIQWVLASGIGAVTTARDVTPAEVEAALHAVGCR
jgi:3-dehydroquinate synthetase